MSEFHSSSLALRPTGDLSRFDVIVIGGGPAGLSAALTLGRARKRVLLCDAGERRNGAATHMHGFVTRDGMAPSEFRRVARAQLHAYDVSMRDVGVARLESARAGLTVTLDDASVVSGRAVLLATGLVDRLPALPGLRDVWGHAAFTCPYCHGWEQRDGQWGALVSDEAQLGQLALLLGWSSELVLFTNGRADLSSAAQAWLAGTKLRVETRPIRRLIGGTERRLAGVELADGAVISCQTLVVRPRQEQVKLVRELGLATDAHGLLRVDEHAETSLAGVYAAGDLASPMHSAALAAAAGTRAAYALNQRLTLDFGAAVKADSKLFQSPAVTGR